jgi:hypothetical protein
MKTHYLISPLDEPDELPDPYSLVKEFDRPSLQLFKVETPVAGSGRLPIEAHHYYGIAGPKQIIRSIVVMEGRSQTGQRRRAPNYIRPGARVWGWVGGIVPPDRWAQSY